MPKASDAAGERCRRRAMPKASDAAGERCRRRAMPKASDAEGEPAQNTLPATSLPRTARPAQSAGRAVQHQRPHKPTNKAPAKKHRRPGIVTSDVRVGVANAEHPEPKARGVRRLTGPRTHARGHDTRPSNLLNGGGWSRNARSPRVCRSAADTRRTRPRLRPRRDAARALRARRPRRTCRCSSRRP